ncbi:hypothetical protein MIMGU_mgv1a024993mg [Erythranthe guttata]|uniref:Uncharacterized protein n=1 Tax=Erythranthe guttata TaxID=4155 RepID=A0A022R506_ERYGU|nr:hypothetical protein MIMGU_mgv1a024993mg [Erythranthe guttata]
MGAYTIRGQMFSTDPYSTVQGVNKLILVDVYLPSCPPKSEAFIDAITKLRTKYLKIEFSLKKQFHIERNMNIGNYDRRFLYQPPSTLEIPIETFF